MAQQSKEVSNWVGWVVFAGFMMILQGLFHAVAGLTALFNSEWFLVTSERVLYFDIETWGWIHLILGLTVFFAGMAVMNGSVFARTVGVLVAMASAVGSLATVDTYPIWSLAILTISVLIIYSLIVHGGELSED